MTIKFQTINLKNSPYGEFECLNELNSDKCEFNDSQEIIKGWSKDNLLSRQNFLFEIDSLFDDNLNEMSKKDCLTYQYNLAKKLAKDKIICRAVYSGSKSIHMIIQAMQTIDNDEMYEFIWNRLNFKFFNGNADQQCKNANRLTRKPNVVRHDRNVLQKCLYCDMSIKYDMQDLIDDFNKLTTSDDIVKPIWSNSIVKHYDKSNVTYEVSEETLTEYRKSVNEFLDNIPLGDGLKHEYLDSNLKKGSSSKMLHKMLTLKEHGMFSVNEFSNALKQAKMKDKYSHYVRILSK